jgi:putative methionine-R-sulfoxide reductase with GAF domain
MQTLEDLRHKKQQVFKGNDLSALGQQQGGNQRRVNAKLIDDKKSQSMLKMSESDALNMYAENQSLQFFESWMKDEDFFIQKVTTSDSSMLVTLFDNIQNMRMDHKSLFSLILRLKRIIKAANTLTASLALNEALEKIVDESCAVLDCDRASVFMVDHIKEELWSKVAKGSDLTIRIPINKGIVGYVATKGESLNILDAYADARFNKEVDLRTNYKTNTILCVPIMEETSRIIGVIQSINKFGGVFTKDDEGLLSILASLAAIILRNSMNYDEQTNFHKYLRLALRVTFHILHTSLPDIT